MHVWKLRSLKSTMESYYIERSAMHADHHYPAYHFRPSSGMYGDPLGFFWDGEYHIFYQHTPIAQDEDTALYGPASWGHTVSTDLVHWKELPPALEPSPGTLDKDACWSGSVVEHGGVFHAFYTGVYKETPKTERFHRRFTQHHATSSDLIHWVKDPGNPILAHPPQSYGSMSDFMNCWHDPFVWRENDCWYMIIDSSYAELRPHTASLLLYRSEDLEQWEFLHPLYETDTVTHAPLPDFFRMGDRRVLIHHCNSAYWYRGSTYIHWLTGRFERQRLEVECSGTLDDGMLYAVRTVEDDRKRRLLWGQILETRPREQIVSSGWSKMQSLPRVLEMDSDGSLHTSPAPELRSLRTRHMRGVAAELVPGTSMPYGAVRIFENIRGTSVEILAKLEFCSAKQGGLVVFCAPDFREFTLIMIDRTRELLVVANRSMNENLSMAGGQPAPGDSQTSFTACGNTVTLDVFLDHSVLEVFAGDGVALTHRVYPSDRRSDRIGMFANSGKIWLTSLDVWEMALGCFCSRARAYT